jgi:hypothetical protein
LIFSSEDQIFDTSDFVYIRNHYVERVKVHPYTWGLVPPLDERLTRTSILDPATGIFDMAELNTPVLDIGTVMVASASDAVAFQS